MTPFKEMTLFEENRRDEMSRFPPIFSIGPGLGKKGSPEMLAVVDPWL